MGPKKIMEVARLLGTAVREFRTASSTLLSETPRRREEERGKEMLIKAAERLGIKTEGKSLEQITQEIVAAAKKETGGNMNKG